MLSRPSTHALLTVVLAALPAATGCAGQPAPAVPARHPAQVQASPTRPAAWQDVLALDERALSASAEASPSQPAPQVAALSDETQQQADALAKAYLSLTQDFAADQSAHVQPLLRDIQSAAKALSDAKEEAVRNAARKLAATLPAELPSSDAEGMAKARDILRAASPVLIDLLKLAPPKAPAAAEIRTAWCPHIQAPWLQLTDEVANPYFGSAMLRCGSITGRLAPPAPKQHQGHQHSQPQAPAAQPQPQLQSPEHSQHKHEEHQP